MEPVTISVSMLYGPDNWQVLPFQEFTDEVTEATNGKVQFEYYFSGALVPASETASGLKNGLVDMAMLIPSYTPADFAYDSWVSKLGFASDASPVAGTLQATTAMLDWSINNEDYVSEFESQGIKTLLPRLQSTHAYGLLCKDDVSTLQEAEGQRIRVGGEAWAAEAENIGGVPVSMPAADVYSAFQQGVLDCFLGGAEDTHALGLGDIGKHFLSGGFTGWSSYSVVMSESAWASLPLVAQQAVWDALPSYLEAFFESNFKINGDFITSADDKTISFTVPDSKMQEAIDTYHDGLAKSLSDSAPSVVADPAAEVDEVLANHKKWLDIITGELGYSGNEADWAEFVEANGSSEVDLKAWAQYVRDEVLAAHRPS